ncbi:copper homeostasis membrane protein CopD [Sphingosinicella xenopeptidilytica]|uniref:Copper homeostasis membrane protein CopD n=1 Tax=Sphingosinicella xenopeptidilytica TaxID=364098 RepID=A0ABW3BZX8_SPHXN
MEWALYGARLVHYIALVPLAGILAWRLYGTAGAPTAQVVELRLRPVMLWLSLAALVGALAWAAATLLAMAGSLEAAEPAVVSYVMTETDFGRLWLARLMLLAILAGLLATGLRTPRFRAVLAMVLVAALAGTGHTQVNDPPVRYWHMAGDALHLVAAAFWIGGLVPLWLFLRTENDARQLAVALHRFSAMGYIAVAVLGVTGLTNMLLSVTDLSALLSTTWGWLLAVKLAAFAAMLLLAAANRFHLLAALERRGGDTVGLRRRLQGHVAMEYGLGLGILGLVAALGMNALP